MESAPQKDVEVLYGCVGCDTKEPLLVFSGRDVGFCRECGVVYVKDVKGISAYIPRSVSTQNMVVDAGTRQYLGRGR